jgi:TrmH family RNA methyltransferase
LPIHTATTFVLVSPHYPENVGAAARAIKTMGFSQLGLVKPSRLAIPEHEMAHRMAVKAWDVLQSAQQFATWQEAARGADLLAATTSRRGVSGVCNARQFAAYAVKAAAENRRVVILFGNEKTGLAAETVEALDWRIRIPMAADQPSINLAQAAQIVAYELFMAALDDRAGKAPDRRQTV